MTSTSEQVIGVLTLGGRARSIGPCIGPPNSGQQAGRYVQMSRRGRYQPRGLASTIVSAACACAVRIPPPAGGAVVEAEERVIGFGDLFDILKVLWCGWPMV